MRIIISAFLLSLSLFVNAQEQCKAPRAIYITLDGLAPYEVTKEHFPFMFKHLVPVGELIATKGDKRTFVTGSVPVSLPSYLTQMTGTLVPCFNNECGRIKIETLPESIKRHKHLDKYDVATIASWPAIYKSAEHIEGATYVNTGNQWHDLPFYHPMIEDELSKLTPSLSAGTRRDDLTFSLAHTYLKEQHPIFLWISLDQSDAYAHAGNREAFLDTLHFYDESLKTLSDTLIQDECLQNTWVVITTDHGRGTGKDWRHHGVLYPNSFKTWALIFNAQALITGMQVDSPYNLHRKAYTTMSFKPMIEKMLGI